MAARLVFVAAVALVCGALRAVHILALSDLPIGPSLDTRDATVVVAAISGAVVAVAAVFTQGRTRIVVVVSGALALTAAQFGVVADPFALVAEDHDLLARRCALSIFGATLTAGLIVTRARRVAISVALLALGVLALIVSTRHLDRTEALLRPSFERQRVIASLLEAEHLRRTVESHPEVPVAIGTFVPTTISSQSGGPRPALVMPPRSRVLFDIPYEWSDAHAALEFAVALDQSAWEELGKERAIAFRVRGDGELLWEKSLGRNGYEGEPPPEFSSEREWHAGRLPLDGISELELEVSTTDSSAVGSGFVCGFANLVVTVPIEGRRVLSRRAAPNLVFIVADTMRADALDLDLDGNTPTLARLAARGTVFERAFAASSWTWPSTATLLTALAPDEHGVTDLANNYLSERFETLPERLQEHGFTTAAWSMNPLVAPEKNFDQGFESFVVTQWERASTVEADVCAWIEANARRRFMLFLQFTDPHGPYEPPEDLRRALVAEDPPGYDTTRLEALARLKGGRNETQREHWKAFVPHAHRLYEVEVHDLDRTLGRILGRLNELGLDERTLVVFTSDHGEEFAEHGRLGHGTQLFDETTHVPLIVAGPGVAGAQRMSHIVESRRVAPTVLDLLNLPAGIGPTEANLFDAPTTDERAMLVTHIGQWRGRGARTIFGLRDPRWLFVMGVGEQPDDRSEALFDLRSDPGAQRNVAREEAGAARERRALLSDWIRAMSAARPPSFGSDSSTREMLELFGYVEESGDE